jgi:hypothetical protein
MLKYLIGFGLGATAMYYLLERPGQENWQKQYRLHTKLNDLKAEELKTIQTMQTALQNQGQALPTAFGSRLTALQQEIQCSSRVPQLLVDTYGTTTDKALEIAKKVI